MYDEAREEWFKVYQPAWLVKHKAELLAEGEAKGRAAAKAELLLSLLEQRRLVVPPSLRERVLAATDELQLQRWFTRAVTATALGDVFDAPSTASPTTRTHGPNQ